MPEITLPDQSRREYPEPVSALQVAQDIGPGLARTVIAAELDGQLADACDLIHRDVQLRLLTPKDLESLEIIRHSCAHLLGQAVKQLYPQAQMVIGPVIDDGFYYDIACEKSFGPEDLERLQQKMEELIAAEYDVIKKMTPRSEVLRIFQERGESYKVRLVEEMGEEVGEMGLYYHQEYIDMCRGPHVTNTRFLKAFRLSHVAGAYWKGDSRNEVLQRVYGTAWPDSKQLRTYLHRLEEAQKRDHRRLGKQLELFHFHEESPGMVFWQPRGWALFRKVEEYMRRRTREDYQEVHTPQLLERGLWESSGHWDKFGEMIFTTTSEKHDYAVKPMNCPAHVQIFNHSLRSYRDLPLRLSEFGVVHRNEPSGTLHGLLRARRFTQDDAHIFCLEEHLPTEMERLYELVFSVYKDFGFTEISLGLSTRPERRVGSDALWDRSEQVLRESLQNRELEFEIHSGEGAFYGPKIEFTLHDSIGRRWQCGTIQLDFAMPERLGARYVGADGVKRPPVMIHRAVLGSLERFIGILIEHHAGALPTWLAPVQVMILNISDAQRDYALQTLRILRAAEVRAEADLRNEKIGLKIREHARQKLPWLLILGDREAAAGHVAPRRRGGEDLGAMSTDSFLQILAGEAGP